MDKGIFFLMLSLTALWLVLDEFYGQQRISQIALQLTPHVETPLSSVQNAIEQKKKEVEQKVEQKKKQFQKRADQYLQNDPLYNKFMERYGPA
jgi:predicted ribosome quality control (RQC) complex YloA/Tae2 family protein